MDKKRILLLESSDFFAKVLAEFLESLGYETCRACDGLEGIKTVYRFFPDLVIAENELPLFKGSQAARFIKSRHAAKNIPVIMFSAAAEPKDIFWGEQAGADFYLEKSPENFAELARRVKSLLEESKPIDRGLLQKESQGTEDNALIETLSSLLDDKLFQTTVVGLLAELSSKAASLEETVEGVLALLNKACHSEICAVMIKDADGGLFVFYANNAGYAQETADDFKAVTIADFNARFSDYKVVSKEARDLFPAGVKNEKLESYIMLPLAGRGGEFATVHIGTSIKEYFSPPVLENIRVFLAAASPIIANALHLRQTEALQKKTRTAFARYVPMDVMDEIIKGSSEQISQGETRLVAVLFSDIRSFTTISENSPARELVKFLNQYFSLMGDEIIAEKGNIDKFIGDAIMAIFGAPKTLENASASAVRAALRMSKALKRVDTSEITLPEIGFGTGIGITFGECVVGNIGFQSKLDYTVIGDTVNLASRLEGITKYYKRPIIVSEYLYANAKDDFIFRKVDSVKVKGKDLPVGLYAVYDAWRGEEGPDMPLNLIIDRECFDQYSKGLKLFAMREWETAKQYFRGALSAAGGDDYLSSMYLARIEELKANPPPPGWDGTITMTDK
ncbi:MAG: adenylate/guanylate cyclase domain-containing response regulator [Treponema sp.]|jgi:class 3 adenylate cyclase/DNA-binding response OmpR family regulator|nr:adenylate/guanylate cyclase domain-containing response regulator [Treponema sp.]